jgi:uncharacterized membrane protein YebE (DUF533 family)
LEATVCFQKFAVSTRYSEENREWSTAMGFGRLVGSLLGGFGGRALGAALGGNTGAMIGSLAGSLLGSQGAGGLTGLFKQHQNQSQQQTSGVSRAALADTASGALGGTSVNPEIDEVKAEILVKAMCSAAKSDGSVDDAEIKAIIGRLGEVDADEKALLERELAGPVDLPALLAVVPKGFEPQVYAASLLAIDSVSGAEAAYLTQLATGLGLSTTDVDQIKEAVGA